MIAKKLGIAQHPSLQMTKYAWDPIYGKVVYRCDALTLYRPLVAEGDDSKPQQPPGPVIDVMVEADVFGLGDAQGNDCVPGRPADGPSGPAPLPPPLGPPPPPAEDTASSLFMELKRAAAIDRLASLAGGLGDDDQAQTIFFCFPSQRKALSTIREIMGGYHGASGSLGPSLHVQQASVPAKVAELIFSSQS